METQQDCNVRMVALANLRAMCERASGICHRYEVAKVSRSRVHVTYSNPDEYGSEHPITAIYPCFPSGWSNDAENPRVLLHGLRYSGGDEYAYQAFDMLESATTLWRSVDDGAWLTHAEILRRKPEATSDHDTCVVCDVRRSAL